LKITGNSSPQKNDSKPPLDVAVVAIPRRVIGPGPMGGAGTADRYDLLITKRLTNTPYAGYWELPGGKFEAGETPAMAAAREAFEELGVVVEVVAVLGAIVHVYEHATVRLHTCVARLAAHSQAPRNLHVAEHAWVRLSALPWDEFLPANVRVVTSLLRYLGSPEGEAAFGSAG